MAKKQDIDQLFKMVGRLSSQTQHDLEKKMAAMVGISGATATGSAAATTQLE